MRSRHEARAALSPPPERVPTGPPPGVGPPADDSGWGSIGFGVHGSEEDASEVSERSAGPPWAAVELFDILRLVVGPAQRLAGLSLGRSRMMSSLDKACRPPL